MPIAQLESFPAEGADVVLATSPFPGYAAKQLDATTVSTRRGTKLTVSSPDGEERCVYLGAVAAPKISIVHGMLRVTSAAETEDAEEMEGEVVVVAVSDTARAGPAA